MGVWWWLSTPYSVAFPLLVLVFGLQESAGHALALFVIVCILSTLSSVVWMLVTAYQVFGSRRTRPTERIKVRFGLGLLSVLLWIVWLGGVT
jgi:hypothetical protein